MTASRATMGARVLASRTVWAGAGLVTTLLILSMLGPLVAQHTPLESDFVGALTASGAPVGPCAAYWLGADRLFRDQFVRLAYAGRISLLIAVVATLIASAVGASVGIVAGWNEGKRVRLSWITLAVLAGATTAVATGHAAVAAFALAGAAIVAVRRGEGPRADLDGWLMRFADVLLAFPFLLLVMAIGAAIGRTSAVTIFMTLGATGWLGMARVLRAKTMQVRSLEYVEASRALGQSTLWVIVKHVLPNVAGSLVVTATVLMAQMIVVDSVLGYLGAGISPPTPTWGRMLFEGQDDYLAAPWLVAAPGGAIVLAVWGFNMLGEGLRDALDPREA